MPIIRLKCLKPRHKIKQKQKFNRIKKVSQVKILEDLDYIEYMKFIKDLDNNKDIKKLIYKQYSSSIELEKLKNKFKEFYYKNEYFKNYCKDNNISYHFLNKTSTITLGLINYKKLL